MKVSLSQSLQMALLAFLLLLHDHSVLPSQVAVEGEDAYHPRRLPRQQHTDQHAQQQQAHTTEQDERKLFRLDEAILQNKEINPFYRGCFQEKIPGWNMLRVCNSDDDRDIAPEHKYRYCRPSDFHKDQLLSKDDGYRNLRPEHDIDNDNHGDASDAYMEIRLDISNWDSSVIVSWLLQILLSEILGVPASVETGSPHQRRSFYDPIVSVGSGLDYTNSTGASPNTVAYAADLYHETGSADCRQANSQQGPSVSDASESSSSSSSYQPCAHFIPEYWDADSPWTQDLIVANKIEPAQTIGYLGHESWFVTKFTADADPTLTSYRGYSGEDNRRKMAETFKRPTTWKDYCQQVSLSNCTVPDDVAQRAPLNEDEENRMFAHGLYTGHFRYTEENDCNTYPTMCTGHVGNYPCGWTSHMEASLYHLNISLESSGSEGAIPSDSFGKDKGKRGYTSSQLQEMWHAANATKNNLIMFWWTPGMYDKRTFCKEIQWRIWPSRAFVGVAKYTRFSP